MHNSNTLAGEDFRVWREKTNLGVPMTFSHHVQTYTVCHFVLYKTHYQPIISHAKSHQCPNETLSNLLRLLPRHLYHAQQLLDTNL